MCYTPAFGEEGFMVERRDLSASHVTHGNQGGRPNGEAAPLTWWRSRSWRKDLAVLARIRHGLKMLDHEDETEQDGATGPEAFGAGTLAAPTALAPPPAPTTPALAPAPPRDQAPPRAPAPPRAATPWGTPPGLQRPVFEPFARQPEVGRRPEVAHELQAPAWSETPAPRRQLVEAHEVSEAPATGEVVSEDAYRSIRESFAYAARAGDKVAGFFYGRLFAANPQLRAMFPPAMDHQRDRLLAALVRIVESLSTPEELAEYLGQLGRDHRKFGVEPAMYQAVGEALIATLRAFAGDAFTSAAQEAWTQAYMAASGIMMGAAEEASTYEPAYWTAEVVRNERRHHGIAVLTVAPDQLLIYDAGQHVTLQTPRWPKVWRSYSVACRPREDGLMIFHVRAVTGGWVSNALVHYSPPGTEMIIGPALGTMVLRHAGHRDLLLVAGGTGLSPLKAIIEQAVKESSLCPRQIYLFYGARQREELYDLQDLWRLADAYPGLQIIPVTSEDPAFAGMQGNVGRVAARYLPHRDCEAYVSGPPEMVAETVRVLKRVGIPPERIHYDDALLTNYEHPTDPSPRPVEKDIAKSKDAESPQDDDEEEGPRQEVAFSRQAATPK
jgi:NAD(P)H-flavin reductase/hemoglobin-like flavoprotein